MAGQLTQTVVLQGGMDIVSDALAINPGRVIACQNYEAVVSGYARVSGYERFDGRPEPHKASYWRLDFYEGTTAIAVGDTITGAASGATAYVLMTPVIEVGTLGGGDAEGYLIVTDLVGSFTAGEFVQVGGSNRARAFSVEVADGAPEDAMRASAAAAAIALRRTRIQKPAGSGPIRGVAVYKGECYCWRDNVGGTAGQMFKATPSGWTLQSFGSTIDFDTGVVEIAEGATITGAISAATATVRRVIASDGSWGTNASGYLVLSGVTGTFQAGEALQVGGITHANAVAAQSAITLPPGGRYEVAVYNFYAASNLVRLYFANGVGRAHEWDGTTLVPIRTGVADALDKPSFVAAHNNHLWLAYRGGSIQHSQIGEPLLWDPAAGAGEFSIGEDPTGLLPSTATALVVFGAGKVAYVVGTSANDFVLQVIGEDSGAKPYTAQKIGSPMYLDDGGVRRLDTTQAFGDWRMGAVSQDVEPIFSNAADAGLAAVASLRVRRKDHYRIYFSDGSGVSVYVGRRRPECMAFRLGFTPSCTVSGEDADGREILLAGSSDGWVHRLDVGTSFDGEVIEAYLRMPFNAIGSPTQEKRFHKVTLYIQAPSEITVGILTEFSYADPNTVPGAEIGISVPGGGGLWDAAYWDRFFWSAPVNGLAEAYVSGIGRNISVAVASDADDEEAHTISAITFNFMIRRGVR